MENTSWENNTRRNPTSSTGEADRFLSKVQEEKSDLATWNWCDCDLYCMQYYVQGREQLNAE